MNIHQRLLSVGMLAASTTCAFAAGGNLPQTVVSVGMHDTGHAMVEYDAVGHADGCATAGHEKLVLIEKTNPSFKYMYATALAAAASGKKLNGWVDGCVDLWGDGRVRIPKALTLGIMGQ
nr:hypothetical protein [uncultured Roseateles sp.]